MAFESIPDLLADILAEQQRTTEAVIRLAEAIANAGSKAPARKAKEAVDKVVEQAAEVAASAQAYAEQKAITVEPATADAVNSIDDPDDTPPADYETAKAAILELSKAKGREAALEVLGRFGVSKLPDLDVAHFGAVTVAAREAVAS